MEFGVGIESDGGGVGGVSVEVLVAPIEELLDGLPIVDALALLEGVKGRLDAKEASLLAARLESGASTRSVESLLQNSGGTSKRSAKQRVRRAKAVKKNPSIAKRMQSGGLSPDQVDVLAGAADKTDGAAAGDEKLIGELAALPPDQGRKVADDWVRDHTETDTVQDAYDRQRRRRCVRRWTTDRDTHVLALEGDQASIDRAELAIRNRSQDLYRADGGREVPTGKHPRTRDQRSFDAAIDLLTTTTGTNTAGDSEGAGSAGGSAGSGPRSTVVVTMTVEQATGVDPTPIRQVGGGLLAPTLLDELFCGADLVGMVVDGSGQPLWLGRSTRFFSHAQWLALIARDGGCADCGVHYSLCHAHHIVAWEAPARGPTDIDNAVLLCTDCHQRTHEHDRIWDRNPTSGTWTTRPATPNEQTPRRIPERGPDPALPDSQRPPRERARPRLHERPRSGALW